MVQRNGRGELAKPTPRYVLLYLISSKGHIYGKQFSKKLSLKNGTKGRWNDRPQKKNAANY